MILFTAIIALSILCGIGKLPVSELLNFIKVVVPAWMLAQGFEDGMIKPAAIAAATATADRQQDTANKGGTLIEVPPPALPPS